jgi:succinate dehydrogenase / fumarate reductase iron-sulfur subunit
VKFTLKVWRQQDGAASGSLQTYAVEDVSADMSFLEMLDLVNENLIVTGGDPIAFDHDCREGICGMCSMTINGTPHGPERTTTACQLFMRRFDDGQVITIEPWRAAAFPVIRDLVVDRRSFDRIMQAGGFISVNTGSAPDANAIPIPKEASDRAFEAGTCIGCGACVAACPNASASLFVAARVAQLAALPQGQPERLQRAIHVVEAMDREGFGGCTNHYECEVVCPKGITVQFIADLNRDFLKAVLTSREVRDLPSPAAVEE